MKKERLLIETSKLLLNEGQLEWLPSNPRTWTRQDLDKLKASIERDPDFLEDRPALIVPYTKGKFIVFGGNMRTAACEEMNRPTIPAMKYIPETEDDRETIKRRAVLDNGSFGAWDFDELANKWDDLPLTDWGVPAWGATIIEDIDGLFVEAPATEKKDDLKITIEVPKGYADKLEAIKASLRLTLDEWQGCKVK